MPFWINRAIIDDGKSTMKFDSMTPIRQPPLNVHWRMRPCMFPTPRINHHIECAALAKRARVPSFYSTIRAEDLAYESQSLGVLLVKYALNVDHTPFHSWCISVIQQMKWICCTELVPCLLQATAHSVPFLVRSYPCSVYPPGKVKSFQRKHQTISGMGTVVMQ